MRKLYVVFLLLIIKGVTAQDTDKIDRFENIIDLLYQKEFYEAIDKMNSFLKNYPDEACIYYNRGLAKFKLNDYYAARKDFIKAKEKGATKNEMFINTVINKEFLVNLLADGYLSDIKLDSANGFKPVFTLKDSLQGALRPERTCFDVYFYDLTIKIIPEEKKIEGSNIIYFKTTESTSKIQLDLFSNYTIHSISLKGKELNFERLHNALFIDFEEELKPNKNYNIIIKYSGIPREAPNPPWNGGFVWKKKKRKHWIGVACEHLGASSWWPNKDHLSDKPDSMKINIQVPNGYQGISNGNLRSTKEIEGNYTNYEWFVGYPINNYNVTFYLGNYENFNEIFLNENGSYPIDYYVLPHNLRKAKKYYKQTKDIVRAYEKLFGEYPFKNDGLAMVEAPFEGMEHQSAIAIGDGYGKKQRRNYENNEYDYLVVHEIAHEWWGNAVAIGDMADAWINEGFATYAEHLFIEEQFGYEEYISAMASTMKTIFNVWPIVGIRDINDNTFLGGDIYHKGAAMLNNLRCIIDNDSLFLKIIKDYYNKYKYKITTTDDFVKIVNNYTNNNYSDFFNKFLYDCNPPILQYYFFIVNNTLSFNYKWINVGKDFTMPFSITLNNDTNIRLIATTELQTFRQDDIKSFYMPNSYRFRKDKITRNSYTYYWTSWLEGEKITIPYDGKSKSTGNICDNLEQGKWIYYYPNGDKKIIAHYLDGKLHGSLEEYSKDGNLNIIQNYNNDTLTGNFKRFNKKNIYMEGQFIKGKRDGVWRYYHKNGKLESTGNFVNDIEDGIWKFYNPNKDLVAKCEFSYGKLIVGSREFYDSDGKKIDAPDTILIADSPPEYRFGEVKMFEFIKNNIVIPQKVLDNKERGTIYISFLINPNGTLSDFRIEKTFSEEFANCLIETFKKMPRWIPAYNKGNPVVVRFYCPFKLKE